MRTTPHKESHEDNWRHNLEKVELNEETWKMTSVVIEAGGTPEERAYLSKFEIFAVEERRFVIKNICDTETLFMVNQLGLEKKVKDEFSKVFEIGQSYLQNKEAIPADILALIIKYQMLKIKEDHIFIRRQRLEVQEGLRRDSRIMLTKDEFKGNISPSRYKGDSVDANKPEPNPAKKYNTVLRERGEEWRDRIYIDDFPIDGPNIYIAVTGFLDPNLPISMLRIGIPVVAVIQIHITVPKCDMPPDLTVIEKKSLLQNGNSVEKHQTFWQELQNLRVKEGTRDDLKNTAFIVFKPPYWADDPLTGSGEKIYDDISYLMYDAQDLSRQHLFFLDNMKVLSIPEAKHIDKRIINAYSQLICHIPLECLTIYSIIDSILQITCLGTLENEDSKSSFTPTSKTTQSMKPTKAHRESFVHEKVVKAKRLVSDIFDTLCLTDADKKLYRITYGEEFESHKHPIVIKYGDFVKYPTFHLHNLNLDDIVRQSLSAMPLHNLWLLHELPEGERDAQISFHVNMLLACFEREDVETAELKRLIHILACRKLYNNRSSLKKTFIASTPIPEFKKKYLKRSIISQPLTQPSLHNNLLESGPPSFPSMTAVGDTSSNNVDSFNTEEDQIKYLFDCPDLKELVSAVEISNEQPISNNLIDELEYFEDFHDTCAAQIMLDAFNKFNCVDYKYCEITDCIILMFFNSHNKNGISREEWRYHIPTPVCLQDFFDFVLSEHYDWIENAENAYDKEMEKRKQSSGSNKVEIIPTVSCVDDSNITNDLLMEGSLKHMAAMEEQRKERERLAAEAKASGTKQKEPRSVTSVHSKLSKISRLSAKSRSQWDIASPEEEVIKPFSGYNISDRRVELFGKDATFFSKDRTKLSSLYTLFIPYYTEYIVLTLVPGDSFNEFWVHRALGDFVTPAIVKKCESFRINTKDQVMINIKKESYQIPLPKEETFPVEEGISTQKTDSNLKQEQILPEFETKYYYGLSITWPNGLIIESVYQKKTSKISHIKQYHLCPLPHLDEDSRCVTLNGEIVIFKTSGDIAILKPDGTYTLIDKYGKRVIIAPDIDPSQDRAKGSVKEGKIKSAKMKRRESQLHMVKEEKPTEYELFIESFEVIEPDGLRQRWYKDVPSDIEKTLVSTATDFCYRELFTRRIDGTYTLLNHDGLLIVTFPDKSKIITEFIVDEEEIYPEWIEGELEYLQTEYGVNDIFPTKGFTAKNPTGSPTPSTVLEEEEREYRLDGYISVHLVYTVEHINFATVTIDKSNEEITISSPNDTSVTVDPFNNYRFKLDKKNQTTGYFDGENLHVSYEACTECKSYTTCDIRFESISKSDADIGSITSVDPHRPWVTMKDSFGQNIAVDYEGNINTLDDHCNTEGLIAPEESNVEDQTQMAFGQDDLKSEDKFDGSISSPLGKCRQIFKAKDYKFIVMNRDLSCSELVHRALLEDYKRKCRWQPWCTMNTFDTFGDYRLLHSMHTPVKVTQSEKFLMTSITSGKPENLTYKDLKKCKKGWYHWMRPYKRYEVKPKMQEHHVTHSMPKAFILRTLEQQWREENREDLKGAKELTRALLCYRRELDSSSNTLLNIPVVDRRSEEDRATAHLLQAVAQRMYRKIKQRLQEDFQKRAEPEITTNPATEWDEVEQETANLPSSNELDSELMEEREEELREVEEVVKTEDHLAQYWKHRADALKEEEFYLNLLREGQVPKYFLNMLGGACWWEINNLTDEAVTEAQRRRMKCPCDEGTPHTEASTSTHQGQNDDSTMPKIIYL